MINFLQSLCFTLVFLLSFTNQASASECTERYFAKTDYSNQFPLKRPPKEFVRTFERANEGVAVEQRNLAISYDAGYLISRCPKKAIYWYKKAAESGDDPAKKWLSRHKIFAALFAGPECFGHQCPIPDADEHFVAVLYTSTNSNDHFYAPVTINKHTVAGVIDTGASMISMNDKMARSFGIDYSKGIKGFSTIANGQKIPSSAVIVPIVEVAGIKLRDVSVSIKEGDGPLLIGMSFLSRLNVSMRQGTLSMGKQSQKTNMPDGSNPSE
jgi:aspartyl protease family protein